MLKRRPAKKLSLMIQLLSNLCSIDASHLVVCAYGRIYIVLEIVSTKKLHTNVETPSNLYGRRLIRL